MTGAIGVMEINGIICEMIFEHNKDSHAFFVEESYVIAWMYPYLEPHGVIMKLNRTPVERISRETVVKDTEFWSRHERLLVEQPGFAGNEEARKAFSKAREGCLTGLKRPKGQTESRTGSSTALRLWT